METQPVVTTSIFLSTLLPVHCCTSSVQSKITNSFHRLQLYSCHYYYLSFSQYPFIFFHLSDTFVSLSSIFTFEAQEKYIMGLTEGTSSRYLTINRSQLVPLDRLRGGSTNERGSAALRERADELLVLEIVKDA